MSFEQWQALRWLTSPTAYANASEGSIYGSMRGLVRRDSDGLYRSTAKGRRALAWRPIWLALDRAASHGVGYLPPDLARRFANAGLVEDLGGAYPTLEKVVRLTKAGHALVAA